MTALIGLLFLLWWLPASAISAITVQADSVSTDGLMVQRPQLAIQLQRKAAMAISAKRIQLGEAWLDNPTIEIVAQPQTSLLISSAQMQMPPYQIRAPRLRLDLPGIDLQRLQMQPAQAQPQLAIDAEVKALQDAVWGRFHVSCQLPDPQHAATWRCDDGLYQDVRSHIPFEIQLTPRLTAASSPAAARGVDVLVAVKQATFSDASGLHAGDKLTGSVQLSATEHPDGWRWQGRFDWQQGELLWQPFYFAEGNKRFDVRGWLHMPYLDIEQATLSLPGVGTLQSQSRIHVLSKEFETLQVQGRDVDFNGLYQSFIQPLVAHSAFGQLQVSGKADWEFSAIGGQPQHFDLRIHDASVEDQQGKFGFAHLNAHLPWDYDQPQRIQLGYASGHVLKIPLGETHWQADVNRYAITTPEMRLPVLDGALVFEDLSAAWIQQHMVWHMKMRMQPISMISFSNALGWPTMRGQLQGEIPLVTYANQQLRMAGEMQFSLFNGKVGMSDLQIDDPLGAVPRLQANFSMRDIDMGEITRTFNFGSISGRLEGEVAQLRLTQWKPVSMNAWLQTADGPEEKVISQRAVENITALGGEGTAAALQRTFLRFFKQFRYEKIGLRCELHGDICKMGGVETRPDGFVIVKGKGLPAVNVNGYTQYVSWKDLLGRMQRITDSNSRVIVK